MRSGHALHKDGTEVPTATVILSEPIAFRKHEESQQINQDTRQIKPWPPALRQKIITTFKKPPDRFKAGKFLEQYNWPEGLKSTVYKSCKKIPYRFFIVDDSGLQIELN